MRIERRPIFPLRDSLVFEVVLLHRAAPTVVDRTMGRVEEGPRTGDGYIAVAVAAEGTIAIAIATHVDREVAFNEVRPRRALITAATGAHPHPAILIGMEAVTALARRYAEDGLRSEGIRELL